MKRPSDRGWKAALEIVERLREGGSRALLAGGCVRDMLLSHAPKDYDVATNATPDQVRATFPRARMVGAKFGVVLVRRFGVDIEVATFRKEGPYSDGRHPDSVEFGTGEEDARRRDFTINGLFFDPISEEVIDLVGGQADLQAQLLRTIGSPEHRFAEDHLRMLRAVRFAARLGFTIEPDTASAIRSRAGDLVRISPERIATELQQILCCESRAIGWSLVVELGLRGYLSPYWPADDDPNVVSRRLAALPRRELDFALPLSTLLCDRDDPGIADICRSLRLSNRIMDDARTLAGDLRRVRTPDDLELADIKLLKAKRTWPLLPLLLQADLEARGESSSAYETLAKRAGEIDEPLVAPPPLLTGDHLSDLGYSPGPRFGDVLDVVYRAQLNEKITTHDQALELAKNLLME